MPGVRDFEFAHPIDPDNMDKTLSDSDKGAKMLDTR